MKTHAYSSLKALTLARAQSGCFSLLRCLLCFRSFSLRLFSVAFDIAQVRYARQRFINVLTWEWLQAQNQMEVAIVLGGIFSVLSPLSANPLRFM